jgi:hypothetical protein
MDPARGSWSPDQAGSRGLADSSSMRWPELPLPSSVFGGGTPRRYRRTIIRVVTSVGRAFLHALTAPFPVGQLSNDGAPSRAVLDPRRVVC